jgi:DNA processing protein
MSALVDSAALSLLPLSWLRDIGPALRAGEPPGSVLERFVTQREHDVSVDTLRRRATSALDRGARLGLQTVILSDPDYPPALAAILDPPPVLWLEGRRAVLSQPAVAIVGSRAGSPYALAVAGRLAADLACCGVVVVSGLARGVDSAAHRGALEGGGPTIGVLGSGADVIYPGEHVRLARGMAESGAVISELLPGTPPQPMFFPRRNRVISGLSRAVVVIEAGRKSGSLITARCALEQGRDVLAVPGDVLNGRNSGGHALLRDGAKIVESADDILEELGLPLARHDANDGQRTGGQTAAIDPILACLPCGEPRDLDAICACCGLSPSRLLPRLFELELQGRVCRAGGGRFVRVDRSC